VARIPCLDGEAGDLGPSAHRLYLEQHVIFPSS
jgi:hypothetical protein